MEGLRKMTECAGMKIPDLKQVATTNPAKVCCVSARLAGVVADLDSAGYQRFNNKPDLLSATTDSAVPSFASGCETCP